jgi:hypothetical protein
MEKRNVIEDDRTPAMEKQGLADDFEQEAVEAFITLKPDKSDKDIAALSGRGE